jgi:hypothetical protein
MSRASEYRCSTSGQGQNGAADWPSRQPPQQISEPASRCSVANHWARRVLPTPAGPWVNTRLPRPERAASAARRRRSSSSFLPKNGRSRVERGPASIELGPSSSSAQKRNPLPRTVSMNFGNLGSSPSAARAWLIA